MTINPIVGSVLDTDGELWAGIWLAEDLAVVRQGIDNRSWVEVSLGGVGAALDGLAFVSDPASSLLQYGLSWLIEHVRPLSEALDWLAGHADAIALHGEAWRSVVLDLRTTSLGLQSRTIPHWRGSAADAYRIWATDQRKAIAALADSADTMAIATEVSGMLVAGVRLLVRDAIATVVSRLIVYGLEELASFGLVTPLVLEQVTTTVAAWAAKIAGWLRALIESIRRLIPLLRRLGTIVDELKQLLARLHGRALDPVDGLHRLRSKGAGPSYQMNMVSVRTIAERYGVDITQLKITVNDRVRGLFGETKPNGDIILYRNAFQSEEDLARTLAHEKFHSDQLAAGKPYPTTREEFDRWEDRAYEFEDSWYDSQPVRPEGS